MKYPIGIQDFRELREGGYVYVDKTEYLHRIIEGGKHFFLSRPRRFGKSLLLSTINELYRGSKELFQGLWIENHWDWEGKYWPVIWLRFASFNYKHNELKAAIREGVEEAAESLGIELDNRELTHPLQQLIQKAYYHFGQKVVLLIDEYDKPIIDYLDEPEKAEANRDTLKWFYSVLKDSDPYLELVFITGVSAFSKVSIFSDLNNLYNLSLVAPARTLLGITQEELEHYFAQPLKTVDKEEVRRWYNGYSWGGTESVYNPFSILSFFRGGGEYRNFWFETGTPTFLVKEMKKRSYFNLRDTLATQHDLNSFDLRNLQPIPILFQTGYLTIKHYEPADLVYTLDYPNQEVRHSLQEVLLKEYLDYPSENPVPKVLRLREAMRSGHLEEAFQIINSAFSEIPYDHWKGQTEHFYHAVVALIFSLLGTYIRSEVHSSRGRCDALVETADRIYALEFKLDKSAGEALRQIQDKGYLEPYTNSLRQKIAVGINFSSTERRIVEWEAVEL
ncbi:AAA family ATPase [Phaeodactylibacter xiamenensis]|uniref:ATP-binding protein n=1 Tax=Phaeodactylibacter xiamenensis TaxID=1524460 RepID=UPI003BAA3B29